MMKLVLLSLVLILMGCKPATDACSNVQEQEMTQSDTCKTDPPSLPDPVGEIPNEALLFSTSVIFTNFEREQEEKVHKALEIIKAVVASREFRKRVYHFTYNGKQAFVDNQGYSNEDIYQILLNASEKLNPGNDHEMDLDLELYYSYKNTVGYTYPNVMRIWMNTKYFNVYTPAEVAGNIFHEWTHKLGFTHDTQYSAARDASVPYALGYIIRNLGKHYE